MDEQTLKMLMEMGALQDEDSELAKQLEFARALRMNEQPLQGTRAGNAFVANNPLQHIASMMERQSNNRDMRDALRRKGEIRDQQTAGRGAFAGLMTPPINPSPSAGDLSMYANDPRKQMGML